jgi:uncharacterized protein (TIGR00297 family)
MSKMQDQVGYHSPPDGKETQALARLALLALVFLLPVLGWAGTVAGVLLALLFSLFVLPRLVYDSGRSVSLTSNLLERTAAYALSVLLLTLLYRQDLRVVAAVWAMMAAGGGVAAWVDRSVPRLRLPWNGDKSWTALAGFVAAGSLAGWAVTNWAAAPSEGSSGLFVATTLTALLGAAMESLPIRLHSGYVVALVCGGFMSCLLLFNPWAWAGNLPFLRVRIFLAVVVSLIFALAAYSLRLVDRSGALAGFFLAAAIYLAYGTKSFLVLLGFFVLGSGATRLGYARKAALGIAERRGGARSWREALANTSAAAFFAMFSLLTIREAAFLAAFVAALAEAAGDTVSSEIGQWLSPRSYLITTFKAVPAGENGGVSAAGSAAGLAASGAIVALGTALGMCNMKAASIAMAAAMAGNVFDSLLGATLERRGLITNGLVNFAGTSLSGGLALALGLHFGL